MIEVVTLNQVLLKAAQYYQQLNWRTVPIEAGTERKSPVLYKYLMNLDPQDTEFLRNFKEHPECPAIAKIGDPDEIVIDIDGGEWPEMPVTPNVITPEELTITSKDLQDRRC